MGVCNQLLQVGLKNWEKGIIKVSEKALENKRGKGLQELSKALSSPEHHKIV